MDKKLLIISASPNKNGTTQKLIDLVISQMPQSVKCDVLNAYSINAKPCIDCGNCRTNIGCVFNDLDDYFKKYEQADYVIFASPVYNMSFPSPMKAIIDRYQRYYNFRFSMGMISPISKPKNCGLILSSGREDDEAYEYMTAMLKRQLTIANGKINSYIICKDRDRTLSLPSELAIKNFIIKLLYTPNK